MTISGNVFIKAGILTIIIFVLGIFVGKYFEDARIAEVEETLTENDIGLGDLQMQNEYFNTFKNTTNFCDTFVEKNLEFGDSVYEWGLKLDKYERANKISKSLTNEKKRYVLFKLQFLLNCIKIKDVCKTDYDVLIYFYNTSSPSLSQRAEDTILQDLKEKCGRKLMFIPLPSDANVGAIELLKAQYKITNTPAIIINEKIKLEELQTMSDLEGYIKCT